MDTDILPTRRRIRVWVQAEPGRSFLRLQWHDPNTGKRRPRTTGTADAKEAEQQRADWEFALNHGLCPTNSAIKWEQFRALFEEQYAAGKREKTRIKFGTVFDVFEQICRPK